MESERVRVSDAERESIISRLNAAAAQGRLSLDEFGERATQAYAAQTQGELVRLVDDLPAVPATWSAAPAVHHNALGTVKRGGRWRLDRPTHISTTFGAIKLDLTDVELPAGDVHLHVRALVGAVKVWLPRHVRVEVDGTTHVGSRRVDESAPAGGGPRLYLHVDTVVGAVKVFRY